MLYSLILTLDTHSSLCFSFTYCSFCHSRLHTLPRTVLAKHGFPVCFFYSVRCTVLVHELLSLEGRFQNPCPDCIPTSTLCTSTEKNISVLSSLSLEGMWRQHIVNHALILLLEELHQEYALHSNLAKRLRMLHVKALENPHSSVSENFKVA